MSMKFACVPVRAIIVRISDIDQGTRLDLGRFLLENGIEQVGWLRKLVVPSSDVKFYTPEDAEKIYLWLREHGVEMVSVEKI